MLPHHVDQHRGRAGGEPEVHDAFHREGTHQAPRAVDVCEAVGEVIAVVGLLQLRHDVIVCVVQVVAGIVGIQLFHQQLDVGLHIREQFVLGDAADGLVGRVEGELLQVVELAEHRELGELRDAGEEYEAQILRLCLQWREETADAVADVLLQVRVVDAVEHRRVILVDEDDHLLAGLVMGGFNQARQSGIIVCGILVFAKPILTLLLFQNGINRAMYQLLLIVLAVREVEAYDGILPPFLLLIIYIQPFKQLLASLEVAAQRVDKQRLAETSRTAEEEVDGICRHHLPYILRLVDIHCLLLAYPVELLYTHGVAFTATVRAARPTIIPSSILNCQLSILNCQFSILNSQLSIIRFVSRFSSQASGRLMAMSRTTVRQ